MVDDAAHASKSTLQYSSAVHCYSTCGVNPQIIFKDFSCGSSHFFVCASNKGSGSSGNASRSRSPPAAAAAAAAVTYRC